MAEPHTKQAKEYIFDLLDQESSAVWSDIQSTPQDTPAELWKKKLAKIARTYCCSPRFALMRLLYCRAKGFHVDKEGSIPGSGADFEIRIGAREYAFRDISAAHAEDLTPEEHLQYLQCLLDLAALQTDSDPDVNEQIITRAWHDMDSANLVSEYLLPEEIRTNDKKRKAARTAYLKENKQYRTRLTREDAFLLGHVLDLTLTEMQWFLLRTLDVGEGFRFNQSEDLVEAYGFLTGASWQHIRDLKAQYAQQAASLPKVSVADRDNGWTKDISDSLPGRVEVWKRYPDTMDQEFLRWLLSQAPGLDIPSRTAGRIYRNLAAFAHDLITGEEVIPDEDAFYGSLQDIYLEDAPSGAALRLLYENGNLSPIRCKAVADDLLLENKIQSLSIQEDNTKAWHVLSTLGDGTLTAAGGVVNSGRSRVADILSGKLQAEKGDMLYLLWFTANLIWESNDLPDSNTICCRIIDFMDVARELLEAALLPEFYPPHPMEQSMLLSIVCGRSEEDSPCVVYEYMLRSLTRQRQRTAGSRHHDAAFKLDVVTHYRSHPELTLEECAAQLGISPKTLSAWQKQLLEAGKLQ